MMTVAQVFEMSVTTLDNSASQDYTHSDDKSTLSHVTPAFKPFTVYNTITCHKAQVVQRPHKTFNP